ncbi:MAG: PQQ-binding-like beta-propeller repeat protein [Planktomarina sp.]|jgi:outer membrane protein assembly factor BamB|nr:PQQ-binding-like beta-propeller repeat protein [Planktomarina sp.]|tara:strand:- start:3022 stop:4335 length:1314 start_codon:yes stop_codon:yes gene_type:complete
MKVRAVLYIGLTILAVGCSGKDTGLDGERKMPDGSVFVDSKAQFLVKSPPALDLPNVRSNTEWTHQGGNAQHYSGHVALSSDLTLQWATAIGQGDSRRSEISASPIIQGDRIFTLDSQSLVTALRLDGSVIWQRNVSEAYSDVNEAFGGGLAVQGNKLFVTTGFGTVLALSVSSGEGYWEQDLASFGGASPTVFDDLLYVSARDGAAWAIETSTGRIKWQVVGQSVQSSYTGGPGAAVSDKYALFPFGSGDLVAAFRLGGQRSWSSILSGARLGRARGQVQDLTGQPVIEGSVVYLANSSGRMAAIDLDTGLRLWTANQGSQDDIFVVGSSLFAVSDENNLIRVSKADGKLVWSTPLPQSTQASMLRRGKTFVHHGPILSGGRLLLASSDALIRQFDPANGDLIKIIEMPSGAASAPIVVGGTLYVLSTNGNLLAFR